MKESLKKSIKISNLFIGGVIGAGFATGQEVYRFFTYYGYAGMFGVVGLFFLLFLLCKGVLILGYEKKYNDFYGFITDVCPEGVGRVFYIIFTSFLFVVFGVMASSMGALFQEAWGMSSHLGFLFYIFFMMIFLFKKEEAMLALFNVFTPLMVAGTILLCIYVIITRDVATFAGIHALKMPQNIVVSTLTYFGYNSILAVSILCTFGSYFKNKKEIKLTAFLCSVIFCSCLMVLYLALLSFWGEIKSLEIPVLYLATLGGEKILRLYIIVLFCAIITTGAGCGYVLNKSMGNSKWGVFALCTASVSFGVFDFSFLIKHLYSFFGVLGFFMVASILFVAWKRRKERTQTMD